MANLQLSSHQSQKQSLLPQPQFLEMQWAFKILETLPVLITGQESDLQNATHAA